MGDTAQSRLNLGPDEVHVWQVRLDVAADAVASAFGVLSASEQTQARRFTFEDGQRHFTVARGALRRILSRYLDDPPPAHAFETGPHGKPSLKPASKSEGLHPLRFNVSHTGDIAVIAAAWNRELGIDIECVDRKVEMENLSKRFFSPTEAEDVLKADTATRRDVFFRIWTTKEAYIKARGDGLSLPLDQFDVVTDLTNPPGLLATRHDPDDLARWRFARVDMSPEFACTLAVEGRADFLVRMFAFPGDDAEGD